MKPAARFQRVSLPGPPTLRAWRILCTPCGASADVADGRRPASERERDARFVGLGWVVGRRRHVCPACQDPPPPPSIRTPETAPMNDTAQDRRQALVADPPRPATREDKQVVYSAIEAAWDFERGLYLGAGSDDVVARAVDKPVAWVRAVRVEFFGDVDGCVSRADGLASLADLEGRARDLAEESLTLAAKFEALQREVAAARKATGV